MEKKVYFISGHLDLTEKEFDKHYKPLILSAKASGSAFVVGDALGADSMAQDLLKELNEENVTVYHMHKEPRYNAGHKTKGGFPSNTAKDSEMTKNSDVDIAWVRLGRENSGTARNLKRRRVRNR